MTAELPGAVGAPTAAHSSFIEVCEHYFVAANRWVLIVLLAAMSVIIFVNVTLRYTTNQSIGWAEEVTRHMMIWLTFLGAGPTLRYGGHIAVENLQDALPRRAAIVLRIVVAALLFVFFGILAWYGWLYAERGMFQLTAVTQIPFGYVYAAMCVGGVLLAVHFLFIVRGYVVAREFASDAHFDATASASL